MSRLEPDAYHRLLTTETERIAGIDPDSLSRDVAHLEGWTVHSVVGHTGWLLRYIAKNLEASPDDAPPRSSVGEPPVGPDVLDWFAEGATALRTKLASVDLNELHPSWLGPQPASWWLRRVTHEVAMHRWDACSAAEGTAPAATAPIDTDLARDGIDEMLEVFAPNRLQFEVLGGSGETIHLHATDAPDGEWLMTLGPEAIDWSHGHAKGDVAARGAMSDLLLLVWSRLRADAVEVFGDATLIDRWQEAATF